MRVSGFGVWQIHQQRRIGKSAIAVCAVVPTIDVSSFDAKHSHPDILNPIAKVDPLPVPLLPAEGLPTSNEGTAGQHP